MKTRIQALIAVAARRAFENQSLPLDDFPPIEVDEPKLEAHGDFATNFALLAAKTMKMPPRKIAEALLANFDDREQLVERFEVAGPGFLNFFVRRTAWPPAIKQILDEDARYGAGRTGGGRRIQVEFVSANPTGPLHVGHGRGAAVGDSVAAILAFSGYQVQREYYINDSGRQINTLGRSVYLRCRELLGESVDFPQDCYQGDYIRTLAREVIAAKGAEFIKSDESAAVDHCARYAAGSIADGIREDLMKFGVVFDRWFSEQSLYDSGQVDQALEDLKERGIVYQADGAWWFKSSAFGDEKDRVVVRRNGQTTYFASDIAYHREKFLRGFDRVIDVWGADHHGYIPRMTAAVEACGHQRDQFNVILVQLVNLLRAGEPVAMSTRSGEFVTLKEVVDEVGADAARFLFLTRDYGSPLDFDLEVAKQQTNENPVYYVQYVHARIASILRKAAEQGMNGLQWAAAAAGRLQEPEEIALIKALVRFPEVVRAAAETLAPHRVTYYLMSLASLFHTYYNKHKVLGDDAQLSAGRLCLILAVQKVIRNGLSLLGVSAPEQM